MADYMKDFWEKEWTNYPDISRSTIGYFTVSVNGDSILDVGCGDLFYCDFPERAEYFCGVDISETAICSAREKHPKASLVQASATSLPFPENHFDAVTSMDMLTLLGSSYHQALEEMVRVSRGKLFFTLSHRELNSGPTAYKCTESNCATIVETPHMEKALFTEDDVVKICRRLKIRPTITVLTVDEVINFGRPYYKSNVHIENGDRKAMIFVEAVKQ